MTGNYLAIGNRTYSSWSMRGWLAVARSGLECDIVRLPMDTPEFEVRIGQHSPTRQVPVLHHDGRVIWDSLAIIEYCSEQGRCLWPADTSHRALARCVSAEMHAGFPTIRSTLPFNCRATGRRVAGSAELAAEVERVVRIWTQCREQAAGGPWLFGEFSGADAMYAPVALRFRTYGVELPAIASDYAATVANDAIVGEWVALAREETEVIEAEERGTT